MHTDKHLERDTSRACACPNVTPDLGYVSPWPAEHGDSVVSAARTGELLVLPSSQVTSSSGSSGGRQDTHKG